MSRFRRCRLSNFGIIKRILLLVIVFLVVFYLHQAINGRETSGWFRRSRSVDRSDQLSTRYHDLELEPYENSKSITNQDLPTILKTLCDFFGVKLVLLDPIMFPPDYVLINDTSISESIQPNNVITLGVFERDHKKFERLHNEYESSTGHHLIATRGIDYRLMRPKKLESIIREMTTHYFLLLDPTLSKSTLILHIALIFRRQNYFWIADPRESNLPPRYRFLNHVQYSIPVPMGVEEFDCYNQTLNLDGHQSIDVCAPLDSDFYIWQLPHAKFHECHYNDVVYPFRSKFPDMGQLNDTVDQAEALGEIMRISKLTRSPTMILCGTLLGWYRQCDYIVESKDVDVGLAAVDYSYEFFKRLFESEILALSLRLGTFDLGLEFRSHTRKGGIWLDVFFLYQQRMNATSAFMWLNKNWYETTYPNRQGLCSAELFGVLAFLPCNYADFVKNDYGQDGWFAPYRGGWYANKNMHWTMKWEDTDEAYMYYGYKKGGCERPDELWGCDEVPPEAYNSTLYQKYLAEKMGNTTQTIA